MTEKQMQDEQLTTEQARQAREVIILECKVKGMSTAETARQAGCSESTVNRMMAQPDFWVKIRELRDIAIRDACGQLASTASKAISKLETLLSSASEQIQLGAARTILEQTVRFRDQGELEERIAKMEQLARETTQVH